MHGYSIYFYQSIIKEPQLVIALDIGSTYSGYAWQHRSEFETNRNNVHFNTNWGPGALQIHKTRSCILLEFKKGTEQVDHEILDIKGGSIDENKLSVREDVNTEIGYKAEKAFRSISKHFDSHELYGQYLFFTDFKMMMYRNGLANCMHDMSGHILPLFDVMSLFIKTLKDHCLNKLKTQGKTADMNKTLFVVTVPAVWTDEAKKFMRDASIAAGIGNNNLFLALEPEAAVIHCLHHPEDQSKDINDFCIKGQKLLLADLGGQTTDCFAMEVEESGFVREIYPPLGDPVGGHNVNRDFMQFCCDSFERDDWITIFGKASPFDQYEIEGQFEKQKIAIGSDDSDDEMINLEVPATIRDSLHYQSVKLKDTRYIAFQHGELMFNSELIRKNLFQETCKIIYETIKKVLKAEGLSTVVLVGGFAESPIVVENIRKMIANDFQGTKVVVPFSPFKAVLYGAVLIGHDPMILRSRINKYVLKLNVKYPNIHGEQKKLNQEITGELPHIWDDYVYFNWGIDFFC